MSEKEALIPRTPVDSSSANPVVDPVSEIQSPLEAESEKEALISRSSVDSSSARLIDDPVLEIPSPLEAESEKEALIPRSPANSSSASLVEDPVLEIPSSLEAESPDSSETPSTKEPVVFIQSKAQICSFSSSSSPAPVSGGTSSTLETSEPETEDNKGGSVGVQKESLPHFKTYFRSIIREGTDPSVPLSGKKAKIRSCLKTMCKIFKYLFDKIGFFLMLSIIVVMGTLLSLCYKGHMEDFYLTLTLSLIGLGVLLVIFFSLLMLLVYEEMRPKKPVFVDSEQSQEDLSLTGAIPRPGTSTSEARTEDIRQRHTSGEVQEERL